MAYEKNFIALKKLVQKSPNGFMKTLSSHKYEMLRRWIYEKTPLLASSEYSLKTKVYWILNNLTDFPKCEICGGRIEHTNVANMTIGYKARTCGEKCRREKARVETKKTCLRKYGVACNMQTQEFKDKSRQTCRRKYGYDFSSQCPEIKKKTAATCEKKYGGAAPSCSKEIVTKSKATSLKRYGETSFTKTKKFVEKTNATCMERYGVMFPSQSVNAKITHAKTCMKRYGVPSYSQTDEFKAKAEATSIERYGVRNTLCSDGPGRLKGKATCFERYGNPNFNNREKAEITCIDRYGVPWLSQNKEIQAKMIESFMRGKYEKLCKNEYAVPCFSVEDYLTKTPETVFKWKCLKCGRDFDATINWNFYRQRSGGTAVGRCPTCYPDAGSGTSYEEEDFVSEVRKIYSGEIMRRERVLKQGDDRRKWLEIDCWLPEIKLGFEYDGLYFHSINTEAGGDPKHFLKTMLAEAAGIRLMHIRSDIWADSREWTLNIVKKAIDGALSAKDFCEDIGDGMLVSGRYMFNAEFAPSGYEIAETSGPAIMKIVRGKREYEFEDCGTITWRKKA